METRNVRYFVKTSKYCGRTNIVSSVAWWTWTKGKGLYVTYRDGLKCKSENTLRELLSKSEPEGQIKEVFDVQQLLDSMP